MWRFMLSLGRALEGRVWDQKDERKVRLLMDAIQHTTGGRRLLLLFLVVCQGRETQRS